MFGREKGERRIPRGRLARLTRMAKMGTRLGTNLAGAAGRAVVSGREEAARRFHQAAAETLRSEFGRMKGLPMKAGQFLSFSAHLIPAEHRALYEEALADLQVLASPMRWSQLEKVIRKDLDAGPDELFESFDREPIAAASIGQVYRATLKGGRPVAVKVQYPGIDKAIRSDLQNIDLLRGVLSLILPKVDVERTLGDLVDRMNEECDYGCELCSQQEFRAIWQGDPDVVVPEAIPELCSDHVLVSELIEGQSWQEMMASATPAERSRNGLAMARFLFRSFYVFNMINADPHPGNYLFGPDGRVAFLDFGCVQRFESTMIREIAMIRRALMRGELEDLREPAMKSARLPEVFMKDDEVWSWLKENLTLSFKPILQPTFQFTTEYAETLADNNLKGGLMFARKAIRHGVQEAKAPGLLFLSRSIVGLYSLLGKLEAEGDWVSLIQAVDAEMDELQATEEAAPA